MIAKSFPGRGYLLVCIGNTEAEARHANILEEEKLKKEHVVFLIFRSWLPFLPDPKAGAGAHLTSAPERMGHVRIRQAGKEI